MLNQQFRFTDKSKPFLTRFGISAIHISIPIVSETFTFTEAINVIGRISRNETITIVDTASPINPPFTQGVIFKSPFRFIRFKSPKRDLTEPTFKRISFKTYPRKLAFKSIKRIDP